MAPPGVGCNADYHANRCFLDAKDISKQVRDSVRYLRLIEEIPGGCYKHSEPDDASHSVERAQMLLGRGEDVQSRSESGISPSLDIELFPESAKVLRLVIDNWEHPAKEEKVARLHRLDVTAEWRRGGWELNAKVSQPAICTAQVRTPTAHHRPACAPPSTCSTSPVT